MVNPYEIIMNELNTIVLKMSEIDKQQKSLLELMKNRDKLPAYVSAAQAAQYFSVHKNTIHNWAKDGSISKYTVKGVARYSIDELKTFVEQQSNVSRTI